MLDSHHQMCCLYLIEVCSTICLNGIMPRKRKLFIFSFSIFTDVFPPSPCNPKELFNLHHACYTPALSLCHVLIFFSILPLCVPPVRFSVPYRTTLAVVAISMFSRYSFLLHWYCSSTASPSSLGHARPLCFPITVTVSHACAASLLVPSSILSCTRESVLVRFLQTLFVPSHYFTALQSAYF